jgi:hypothetical protein
MRSFSSIEAFLAFLPMLEAAAIEGGHVGVRNAAEIVQTEAKALIGQENVEAGGHVWPDLAARTITEKERLGYVGQVSATDPLLRTGELRASIQMQVEGNEAAVGSDDPVAEWQELGTSTIPARSFLGGAAFRKESWAIDTIAGHVVHALAGSPNLNHPIGEPGTTL